MTRSHHVLMLVFFSGLCAVEVVSALSTDGPVPGGLQNVSKNDTLVKKAVLTGTYTFNNRSNDVFLFKASAIDEAKRKVVKGILYVLTVEISRTVCRKMKESDDLTNCAFQSDCQLKQTFLCHFEIWSIPWMKIMSTTYFNCQSSHVTR